MSWEWRKACSVLLALIAVSGCDQGSGHTATLYRNSPLDLGMRVEWGSFRANESDAAYNIRNCELAAALLNANLDALARQAERTRTQGLGFWCEPGDYRTKGSVPASFVSRFPTDT